ncbi:hypothetical protein [Pseudomonas sp. JG-B]|uniref:hypothetical protein n=1 Tax=Pseudomonas sp. JG-B TaxID=2603214 RepID=UPI00129EC389|nr:hypothetical protein [Pseudomonas sp. JG-B]MRK22945.1 hypothetical protein [Pseudomonas sp. JG-B]
MAIEDSDPERRNLTVMSGAFIIYYLAGGSFKDNEITLEVVNINFSRPTVLAVIAWLMLFWFIYRYWQAHRGKFRKQFPEEFERQQLSKTLKRHLDSTLPKYPNSPNQTYFPVGVRWKDRKVTVEYVYASSIRREQDEDEDEEWYVASSDENGRYGEVQLSGIKGWFVALLLTCKTFISDPSFANYIIPYLLAALAIVLGAENCISKLF